MAKKLQPLKSKPVYEGERLGATSKEKLLCRHCSRLATHRGQRNIVNGNVVTLRDLYFCDEHLNHAIREGELRRVRMLPKYRIYLHRLKRWDEQQHAEDQEALF